MVRADARPVLLYLPGMDGSGKLFFVQEARLAPYCDVRSLSIPLDDQGDWESLLERVYALLPEDGRPVILCGESFGGCLALQAALRRPEAFSRLVVINPASSWRRQTLLVQGSHWLSLVPSVSLSVATLVFLPFLSAVNRLTPADRRTLLATMRLVSQKTILHRLHLLEHFDLDGQLGRLTMPVLLLGGQADRLLPSVDEVYHLAGEIPDAHIEILPNSGHAALLESETDLAGLMLKYGFLSPEH